MDSARSAARTMAALFLLQLAGGPIVNFVLLGPLTSPPGFLLGAAAHPSQIGVAVLVGLVMGSLAVGISIVALSVLRRYSETMALWLLALALVGFMLATVEQTTVLSMLSLSQAYASANAADGHLLETVATLVGSARNWAHYMNIIIGGGAWAFVLFSTLLRFALVPRALAAFGIVAALLMLIAAAMPLFGRGIVFLLFLPAGLAYLALALWLMVKGFAERQHPFADALPGVGLP